MGRLILLCFLFCWVELNAQGLEKNATYKVGLEALSSREFSRAVSIFSSLTEQYPKQQELWYNLGVAYFQQGMGGDAREAFLRLADIAPDYPRLATLLFRCGAMEKDWEFMAMYQERAIAEGSYEAFYYRGVVANKAGKDDAAIADYRKALALYAAYAPAAYDLGIVYYRRQELDSASVYLGIAHSASPNNYRYLLGKSLVLRSAGSNEDALPLLARAQRLKPDSRLVILNLGGVYFELAQYEEALACFLSVLEMNANDPIGKLNTAATYLMLGDDLNAMKFLAELDVPDALAGSLALNLGITYENLFQEEKACRYYQKAFEFGVEKAGRYLRSQCEP